VTEIESAPPKLFIHCITVFERMRKDAKYEDLGIGDKKRRAPVYEGFTTKLFQSLGLAGPYYTTVMRRLQHMECIKQLSRGGGSAPSRWELLKEPEYGDYDEVETKEREGSPRLHVVDDHRLTEIERRLDQLEELKETGS